MTPNRTGKTLVPGAASNTGQTAVPGQGGESAGLDKMLEVVAGAPDPAEAHAALLVISGSDPGRLHVLDRPELVIGRSKYADVRISERAMSQQHAKVVRLGDRHRIYDLGSTNGTFVNDAQVEQADLKPGDVVRTGETVFTYMSQAGGEPAAGDKTLALPAGAGRGGGAPPPSAGALVRVPKFGGVRPSPQVRPQVLDATGLGAPDADDGTDLIGLLMKGFEFVGRYWLSIVICAVLGTAGGIASYKVAKPKATAEFEMSLRTSPTDNPVERGRRQSFEFFRSAKQSFERPSLIADTLAEMGETDITPKRIRAVKQNLSFKQSRASQEVWNGSYQAAESEEAISFLQVHVKLFLEREIDNALKMLIVEVQTLEARLKEAKEALTATEQEIATFKQEHSEGLPENAQEYYRELISLGSERGRAASEVARTSTNLRLSKRRLKSRSPIIEKRISEASPYENAIADVRKELSKAQAAGKGAAHPQVIELKQQLATLTKLRDQTLSEGTGTKIRREENPVFESARLAREDAEAAHKIAQTELSRLTNDLNQTKRVVAELPRLQAEYSDLSRSYEANKQRYNDRFEKLNASRLTLDLERAQTSKRYDIIVPPNVKPISPVKTMITRGVAGFGLGLFLGIGLGLFRDLRRVVSARIAQTRGVRA